MDGLRRPPMVHVRHLVYARDGTVRRAAFLGEELTTYVGAGVLLQRNARVAPLLRAIVHQPILADVQIAGAGAAAPVVRVAIGNVVLEAVESRIVLLRELLHLLKHRALGLTQWPQLSVAIVDDPDSR